MRSSGRRLAAVSLLLVCSALLCLPFADIALYPVEPWTELSRMALGLLHPDLQIWHLVLPALAQTVAFALVAVAGSAVIGLGLALVFHSRFVRLMCAATRAVHEIFWGLIFMQVYGLSATTGLLAILVPFSGIFAKVFAELLAQQSPLPSAALATSSDRLSRYCYTLLPQAWPALLSYTRYRFECALRSSTVLGFIGLPTLGFHLETAFKQGQYDQAATLLLVFFALIGSIRYWFRPRYTLLYLAAALWILPASPPVESSAWLFFSQDIWPRAVRNGHWPEALSWYLQLLFSVALPAVVDTLLLSQLALVLAGLVALLSYGWASRLLAPSGVRHLGKGLLLVLRSTPEIILTFIFLLLLGPSGLPAILALGLHNGGLIAFLLAKQSDQLVLRQDTVRGLNRYFYEVTPRLYGQFMGLMLYRWEVILRESAILGLLGVTTLGFYIDSAFEEIRFDRAALLIVVTALLNIGVDSFARRVRGYCQVATLAEQ
ncbi:hypothetical protein [Reinekea sp.]|uniref:PhnE/PtxC family ABC transporter permease n=1 Tax=Reinekea sp. TaxID=1970455 RepID=UPI002A807F60|nr:hypothetical protein [Reinekea sp.]